MVELEKLIVSIVRGLGETAQNGAPLHEPVISEKEERYVVECLRSGFVSSVGNAVVDFENRLASYLSSLPVSAVSSGTAALHLCLRIAGVAREDEVITSPVSFVATSNAIKYQGAIPHFVDVDYTNFGMCPDALNDRLSSISERSGSYLVNKYTGRRITAVLPTHVFGLPCKIDKIIDVSSKFNLPVIEDAAEALGTTYKGKHIGTFGVLSALSFNGNKIITTGGGGAVVSNKKEFCNLAKHLSTTAKKPHKWAFEHDYVGYNYRMPNINAALGLAQLESLTSFINRKQELSKYYENSFSKLEGVEFIKPDNNVNWNYWLNTLRLKDNYVVNRDKIIEYAHENKIYLRPVWKLLSDLKPFKNCPKASLLTAKSIEACLINLPSGAGLR